MSLAAWLAVATPPVVAIGLWAYGRAYARHKRNTLSGLAGVLAAFMMPNLVLGFSLPFFRSPQTPLHYAGYGLMVLGAILCAWPIVAFRSSLKVVGMDTNRLVTTGPYRFSRNPQYIFYSLVLIGYAMTGRSWLAFASFGMYWMIVHPIILIEEKHLEQVYGEAYRQYKKTTRRYL
jgi:protein-S-isoprenylcysteine O-methyltransferase Ste14